MVVFAVSAVSNYMELIDMNRRFAVYTQETECLDCYKCLRSCASKAIVVKDAHASIDPEKCIACGHCVEICPSDAKKIRNDISRVKIMLEHSSKVFACIAPSWKAEFPGISSEQLIATLKKLGFAGVVEAALGAQEVSRYTAQLLQEKERGVYFSSACPAAVDYIKQHYSNFARNITPVASPAVVTANMIKGYFGRDAEVVFIGPCTAKKNEADACSDYISVGLTFKEIRQWLASIELDITGVTAESEEFVLAAAEEGVLYPVEGGMIETIKPHLSGVRPDMVCISGIDKISSILDTLDEQEIEGVVFIETLACENGCLGGAGMDNGKPGLKSILDISRSGSISVDSVKRPPAPVVEMEFAGAVKIEPELTPEEMAATMKRVGKDSPADELNCGGCGYNTCREFATALARNRAEESMCVSYMRRLAQKKANALLRSMPSGVVIINENMEIIESNISFARLFGEDTENAFEVIPGLKGARLASILPFGEYFSTALRTGEDIRREHLECADKLLNVNIFVIERGKVVGAVIEDVTNQELKREQIAKRAKEVIQKNITTVQEIACLLGEHITDTEVLLSRIADDYVTEKD